MFHNCRTCFRYVELKTRIIGPIDKNGGKFEQRHHKRISPLCKAHKVLRTVINDKLQKKKFVY